MIFLASYDIASDRLRVKVAAKLQQYGLERIQYSVFIGPLNPTQREKLDAELSRVLNPKDRGPTDQCLLIPVTYRLLSRYRYWGESLDLEYLTGRMRVLFL